MVVRSRHILSAVGVALVLAWGSAVVAVPPVPPAPAVPAAPAAPQAPKSTNPAAAANPAAPADPLADMARRMLSKPDEHSVGVAPPTPSAALPSPSNPAGAPATPATPTNERSGAGPSVSAGEGISANAPAVDAGPRRRLGPDSAATGQRSTAAEKAAGGAGGSPWWLQTAGALAAVVVLILVLRSVFFRWTGRARAVARSPVVEVLSRVPVAPRNHVLLVRMGNRILVIGDSQQGLRTLANIKDPEEVAALLASVSASRPNSISAGFHQLVRRMSGDGRGAALDEESGADHGEVYVDRARDQMSDLASRLRQRTDGGGPT